MTRGAAGIDKCPSSFYPSTFGLVYCYHPRSIHHFFPEISVTMFFLNITDQTRLYNIVQIVSCSTDVHIKGNKYLSSSRLSCVPSGGTFQ